MRSRSLRRLRDWSFMAMCLLAAEGVVLGAWYFWTTNLPEDALATITISRDWMFRLQEERGRQSEQVDHLRDMLREMGSVCELTNRYGGKGM